MILQRRKRGFTLIELLVVVAIIGILTTITLSFLSTIKMRGKDAGDVRSTFELQKAINTYFLDRGEYPFTGMTPYSGGGYYNIQNFPLTPLVSGDADTAALAANLQSYISALPTALSGAGGVPKNVTVRFYSPSWIPNGYGIWNVSDGADICYFPEPDSYIISTRVSTKNSSLVTNQEGYHTWNLVLTGGNVYAAHATPAQPAIYKGRVCPCGAENQGAPPCS